MLTQIILFLFFRTSKFFQNKKYSEKCGTGLHFANFFDVFNFFLSKENLNFWNPKIARFLPLLWHLICCAISFWLKHMKKILPHIDRLLEGGSRIVTTFLNNRGYVVLPLENSTAHSQENESNKASLLVLL